MPLYERAALYSIAECAVVTATRDGMNLVPYEYVVCRQGVPVRPSRQPPPVLIAPGQLLPGCDTHAPWLAVAMPCGG